MIGRAENCRIALAPLLGRTIGEGARETFGPDVAVGWWYTESRVSYSYSFDVALFAREVGSAFALTSQPTARELRAACDAPLDGKPHCRGFHYWADAWVDRGILAGPKLGTADQVSPRGVA